MFADKTGLEFAIDSDESIKLFPFATGDEVSRVKWIEVKGTKYYTNTILRVKLDEFDNVIFGKIRCIYVVSKQVFFQVQLFTTIEFNDHFHAYQVRSNRADCTEIVSYKPLYNTYPCLIAEKKKLMFITTRHMI